MEHFEQQVGVGQVVERLGHEGTGDGSSVFAGTSPVPLRLVAGRLLLDAHDLQDADESAQSPRQFVLQALLQAGQDVFLAFLSCSLLFGFLPRDELANRVYGALPQVPVPQVRALLVVETQPFAQVPLWKG